MPQTTMMIITVLSEIITNMNQIGTHRTTLGNSSHVYIKYNVFLSRKEYFFIEGAKNLANRIQNLNAIIPSPKQEYRNELKDGNQEYKNKFIDNDPNALPNCLALMNGEKSKIATLYSCPTWSNWRNNGGCSRLCNRGRQRKTRRCLNGSTDKPTRLCETSGERAAKTIVSFQNVIHNQNTFIEL